MAECSGEAPRLALRPVDAMWLRMSRIAVAGIAGVLGFLFYVGLVVALADHVLPLHWLAQLLYFVFVGVAWAWPAKLLIIWGAGGSTTPPSRG
jgi:hypothetical protein